MVQDFCVFAGGVVALMTVFVDFEEDRGVRWIVFEDGVGALVIATFSERCICPDCEDFDRVIESTR